ncbi:MAG: hypothetical protein KKC79_14680 [Gammaproteobacteria bacterium]|nr:hypothetical protein [Gammaproteobacteria bacterium]MBU1442445.1 hypothetical protein [Gammaproteobacteria bacterium]MBU2288214.1 hypothetical protein [Gammaproteobacteria bacterium]MBU2409880.1 hypothetical protein [Gammaproteobacteria bacterium]
MVGERMVDHIRRNYGTRCVDYLVSSHPCPVHSEGLAVLMTNLQVRQLWMHRGARGPSGPGSPVRATAELEHWAQHCSIPIHEPFAGAVIGPFTVLSPDRAWYDGHLAPAFGTKRGLVTQAVDRAARLVRLSLGLWGAPWNVEPLPVSGRTSAECESSAVLYAEFAGRGVLLTGGAGCGALDRACASAEALGIELRHTLKLMQIPNRGRTDNVSSALLDRMLGPRVLGALSRPTKSAFVSLPQQTSLLECRLVAAALRRRGVVTFATQGKHLHHSHDMPERDWPPARAMHSDGA